MGRDGNGDATQTGVHTNLLALPDGTELVGDYRIKRVLGAGGFGITYLADEMALARLVTIKEYFPADFAARRSTCDASPRSQDCAEDYKWGLERFIEEAQTLARFVHPNIVRVYRYFRANNTGYMVLHFEEGGSFKAWLKGLKRAPRQNELDKILNPLLDALEMVHGGAFLHRDIAPDNIIIRKDGSPVLIDFGSARGEIASHSKTVSALVKPGYSPYEQYATTSRQQGPWTDIYALGATLYHAVSGKRPPDAPSRMVNDEYVPARAVALSSYRPTFLAAIDKSLRLEIGERPQSVAQWREQLLAPEPKRDRGRLSLSRALDRLRTGGSRPQRPPPATARQHGAALAGAEPGAGAARRPAAQGPAARLHRRIEETPVRARRQEGDAACSPALAAPLRPVLAAGRRRLAIRLWTATRRSPGEGRAGRGKERACRGGQRPATGAQGLGPPDAASPAAHSRPAHPIAALALAALSARDRPRHRRRRRRLPGQAAAHGGPWRERRLEPGHRSRADHPHHRPQGRGHGPRQRRPGTLDRVGGRRWHAQGVERRLRHARALHRARRRPRHGHCRRRPPRAHRPQGRRHRAVGPGARREARRLPEPAIGHLRAGLHRRCRSLRRRRPDRGRRAVRHPHAFRAGEPCSRVRMAPRRSPAPACPGCWRRRVRTAASSCGARIRAASHAAGAARAMR